MKRASSQPVRPTQLALSRIRQLILVAMLAVWCYLGRKIRVRCYVSDLVQTQRAPPCRTVVQFAQGDLSGIAAFGGGHATEPDIFRAVNKIQGLAMQAKSLRFSGMERKDATKIRDDK